MRTQEEILNQIAAVESNDFFGAYRGELIDMLTFENAKQFLKEGVTEEEWNTTENTVEAIKAKAIEYLPFAWDKANSCRGLSANRSIDHLSAIIWLLNDEDLRVKFDETEYEHYGKEKLIVMSEYVGFDWQKEDDGIRTNTDC